MKLEGKTAVVTGASSGLGRAIAQMFAAEGAHVYLVGRRQELLLELEADLAGSGTAVVADVSRPEDLDRLYDRIESDGRGLDVVVANAGGTLLATLDEVTPDLLRREWGTNVDGTIWTVQKSVRLLRPGAAVILMGSTAADKGTAGVGLYSAAKAAIRSLGRTWANELKDRGVRVNTISPGTVLTDALDGALRDHRRAPGADTTSAEELTRQAYEGLVARIPLGRLGHPDEVARLALFLATDDSSFITGSNVYVDGGLGQI